MYKKDEDYINADERPQAKDIIALLLAAFSIIFPVAFMSIVGLVLILLITKSF